MAVQIRNAQMVDLLTADFIRRNEPAPYLGRAINTYLALPQLRGFWPFSSVDENDDPYDMSMQGRTLTNNNSVAFNSTDFLPYAEFDGSTNYLSRASEPGLDITGSITLGCWVYFDNALGSIEGIMAKTGVIADRSWYALRHTDGTFRFIVHDGSAESNVYSVSVMAASAWYFTAARLETGTETSVFVNDEKTDLGFGRANINSTTQPLALGVRSDLAGNYMDGRIALPFICATNLSDARINNLYQQSRVLFGV